MSGAPDEMKTAFLRSVSHEVRTPLAAISGFAHLLAEHGSTLSPEQLATIFQSVANSAAKLERMFTEMSELDRLSRGLVVADRAPCDLLELAQRAVDETDTDDHPVTVSGNNVGVDVDTPKVERIVHHLVLNAVRHTPPATPIDIRIEDDAGSALIVVDDSGEGIPDDLKDAIFEPFRQGKPSAPGIGIGLALVAELAELHGGRAWVEDSATGGARFMVLLVATP